MHTHTLAATQPDNEQKHSKCQQKLKILDLPHQVLLPLRPQGQDGRNGALCDTGRA